MPPFPPFSPPPVRAAFVLPRLDALRVELADLAFALERRGRADAADLALAASARVGEVLAELETGVDARTSEGTGRGIYSGISTKTPSDSARRWS